MYTQAELIDWLRDVYAMKKSMEAALHKLTVHPQTHPALREQAALHGIESRQHAEALASCLRSLGAESSSLRTVLAQGVDPMRHVGTAFTRDERIKDVVTVLVTAHFEIACHTILRTGASQLGQMEIVHICEQIQLEEKRMVKWLQMHLPQIISSYMAPAEEEVADEEDDEFDMSLDGQDRSVLQWEFVQLAHNASLFGGPLPRAAFAAIHN